MYIVLGIIVIVIIFIIFLYNRIVSLNVRCDNAWASIDNQLKRRTDLIPNLVEMTKGYAKYESETLEKIVSLRANSISEKAKQSEEVSKSLTNLLAISENYPELKADKVFSNLQIELVGTEDKIAYARQFYNDTVQHFNTTIMMFPNNILANMLKFKEKEYFKVSDEDKKVVEVKL
ncbi:MAG: LemA family protein [Firmicutes bacterium]|nr:LemA family protein [Bacillota bacterium]